MKSIIMWCNNNEGFLTAIFSVLGVIANVVAIYFSGHALCQTKREINIASEHQKQNIGMTLYPLRREILILFSKEKYNELLADASTLFTNGTNEKIKQVSELYNAHQDCQDKIEEYERRMLYDFPELYDKYKIIQARINATYTEEPCELEIYEELYELCDEYRPLINDELIDYREKHIRSIDIYKKYSQRHQETYNAIKNEIQESIISCRK